MTTTTVAAIGASSGTAACLIITDCLQQCTQVGFGDVRYPVPLPPVAAGSSLPNMAASHAPVFDAPAGSNSRVAAVPLPGQLNICGGGARMFAAHRLHICSASLPGWMYHRDCTRASKREWLRNVWQDVM